MCGRVFTEALINQKVIGRKQFIIVVVCVFGKQERGYRMRFIRYTVPS